MCSQPQRTAFEEPAHQVVRNLTAGYITIVHHVGAQPCAEAFLDRNGGKKVFRRERYAKSGRHLSSAHDAEDCVKGLRSGSAVLPQADLPVPKILRSTIIVPRADRKDIWPTPTDSFDQRSSPVPIIDFVKRNHYLERS